MTHALPDLRAEGRALVVVRRTLAEIADEVCDRCGDVRPHEVFGACRERRVVLARQEVIWTARRLGYTLHMIGRRFPRPGNLEGCMDHSSVHSAERRHRKLIRAATMATVTRDNAEAAAGYREYVARRSGA